MIKKMSRKADVKKWEVINLLKRRRIATHIKSHRLEQIFKLSGSEIRSIVHFARSIHHLPVCSDSAGYFYATNKFQTEHTIRQMRSRIRFINEAVCGIEKAIFEPEEDTQRGFGFNVKTKYDGYPD